MSGESIRVLHVDDEPDFAAVAADFLEREDDRLTVETATSAEEGLDRLAETDFDCVVSDYDMPRTNGIEFLERVREESPDRPFILFTGKGSEEVASDAVSTGVTDYLQKQDDTSQYTVLANRIRNAVEQYRTERRAELQQRQYRRFFEQAPVMYVVTRDDGGRLRIEDCNDRFLERLGYSREEVIDRPISAFYTEAARRKMHEGGGYEQALHGEFGMQERTLVTEDGERIHALTRTNPRLDGQGTHVGAQAMYLDVTERRERARRLELAIQCTRSGVWEYDVESGMVTRHEGASNLWAEDAHTTVPMEQAITERVHPEDQRAVRDALEATVDDSEPYRVEFRQTTPDGYRWAEARGELVREDDSDPGRLIACTTDIDAYREREAQLREERNRLSALFDGAPQPMIEGSVESTDTYNIVDVNDVFEATFGYDADEIVGQDIAETLVPADERAEHERFRDRVAAGESFSAEVERTTVDGGRTFLIDVVSYGVDSIPADGWFATFTDISDRKERERELELYETMIETVPDGLYVLGGDLELDVVNQGMVDMLGYSKSELVGSHLSQISPEHAVESARQNREAILDTDDTVEDEIRVVEHVLITAHGEEIPCEVRFRALPPAEDGSFRGTAGVVRDVTEREERERELERQNERLEEFASMVSHDLRNPLNVAEGKVELAREEHDSEQLDGAAAALDRMDALIEDLLTLAREGRAVEETGPVDLPTVVDACWNTVETADATLVDDTDLTIDADGGRLQQLLENLIRNAVEHGGTAVTITVGDFDDGTGFYVADDGHGIPADERERVFERGYSTAEDGTGFGLAIVGEIAEAHGWDLDVTESADGGARFEITGVETVA